MSSSTHSRAAIRLQELSQHFSSKSSLGKQTAAASSLACSASSVADSKKVRLLTIGGGAAAVHFAARARRISENADITVLEPSPFVQFADEALMNSSAGSSSFQSLQNNFRIVVRVNMSVVGIDRGKKEVYAKEKGSEELLTFPYDKLLLACSLSVIRPPYAGCSDTQARVCTLRNVEDLQSILQYLPSSKRVSIIGGGVLALHLLERIRQEKHVQHIALIESNEHVLPLLDGEFSAVMESELRGRGVSVYLKEPLKAIHHRPVDSPPWRGDHFMEVELENAQRIPSDLTILSMTGSPDTRVAAMCGLKLTNSQHVLVNDFMQTSDESIYAAGETIATKDLIYPEMTHIFPLGGSAAHRQGRLAADHALATLLHEPLPTTYPGSLSTAIVRAFSMVCAITGWPEHRLDAAGKKYNSVLVSANGGEAAGECGSKQLLLKLLYSPEDRRVLGAQVAGPTSCGVDKCIDVLAVACSAHMTIEGLQHVELSHAPQLFYSGMDAVNVAAFAAVNQSRGTVQTVSCFEDVPTKRMHVIDVRDPLSASQAPLKSTRGMHVHRHAYAALRQWLHSADAEELKKSTDAIVVVCSSGKDSYFAARILQQNGFADVFALTGGLTGFQPQAAVVNTLPLQAKHSDASMSSRL